MKAKDAESSFIQLKKNIKSGELPSVILLYGEERYLRLQYLNMIMKYFGADVTDMNTNIYEGKGIEIGQVIDQAETLPFFAEKRVIIIKDSGLFKSGGDQLAEYLDNPCDSVVFLFSENEVDERSKLYKSIQKNGFACQIDYQTRESLIAVIGSFLKKEGKAISMDTAQRILDKTGTDMAMLRSELEKLVTYCMDKDVISLEDVETICSENIEDRVFDMIDALAEKNAKKTMGMYYDLLALKQPPIKLLSLLERQYNQLLMVRMLRDSGELKENIASKLGIRPYFIGKYMSQASRYTAEELKMILNAAVCADENIKKGHMSDILAVETLLVSLLK